MKSSSRSTSLALYARARLRCTFGLFKTSQGLKRSGAALAMLCFLLAMVGALPGNHAAAAANVRGSATPPAGVNMVVVPASQYANPYQIVDLGTTGNSFPASSLILSRHTGLILASHINSAGVITYQMFQITNGTVGPGSPVPFPACFIANSMNDQGTIVGSFGCGPNNGKGAHKVLVETLGIRSGLQCGGAQSSGCHVLDNLGQLDVNGFAPITDAPVRNDGFVADDTLLYSYRGGNADPATGLWHPNDYQCSDTAEDYRLAIGEFRQMLVKFGKANPNTDFYLVAHSQGGLIAFQSLGLIDQLPKTTSLKLVVTFDSPLGDTPQAYVDFPSNSWLGGCWIGPANQQMVQLYNSTPFHQQQGSAATVLCALLHDCSFTAPDDNSTAAGLAGEAGVQVVTYGNSDDAVYNINAVCFSQIHFVDNSSSEVVDDAGGGLQSLGVGLSTWSDPTVCASSSHAVIYSAHIAEIVDMVGAVSLS